MTIEWIKCSERMPPDDDSEIFIKRKSTGESIQTPAREIWFDINPDMLDDWEWAPWEIIK